MIYTKPVLTHFDAKTIKKIDRLRLNDEIDSRSAFIRDAVDEKLDRIKNKDA